MYPILRQRPAKHRAARRKGALKDERRMVRLTSPWGTIKGCPADITALAGRRPMARVVAMAIKLLKGFLEKYLERCGEVVEVLTNVGEFVTYITKNCYPKGLERQSYIESIAIHRNLEKAEGEGGQKPRELKAYYIY